MISIKWNKFLNTFIKIYINIIICILNLNNYNNNILYILLTQDYVHWSKLLKKLILKNNFRNFHCNL